MDHGHRIFGEREVLVVDGELHKKVPASVRQEFDAPNLSDLKAVDEHGVSCGQARHVVVHGVKVFGPRQGVEPLEVVHPKHEKDNARHGEHPNFEF